MNDYKVEYEVDRRFEMVKAVASGIDCITLVDDEDYIARSIVKQVDAILKQLEQK
jgi:hypothetical protein